MQLNQFSINTATLRKVSVSFLGSVFHLMFELRLTLQFHIFYKCVQFCPRLWIFWNEEQFPPFHDPLLKDARLIE